MFGQIGLRLVVIFVTALAVFGLSVSVDKPVRAEPIVLKGITPWTKTLMYTYPLFMLQDMIADQLKGKLELKYLGASEVVPAFEQFEALTNGVVDIALNSGSYYKGQLPVVMATLYTNVAHDVRRTNGYFDLMRDYHMQKSNVYYLADVGGMLEGDFRYLLRKKLDKPDFTGLKIRGSQVYTAHVKALGGAPVIMKLSDAYTALERGVVDGMGFGRVGVKDYSLQEVVKYVIDHPFYVVDDSILINGNSWKKLPADIRDKVEQMGIQLETDTRKMFADQYAKEDQIMKELGIQFIRFSNDDAAKFRRLAYQAGWKDVLASDPILGAKLKALGYKSE